MDERHVHPDVSTRWTNDPKISSITSIRIPWPSGTNVRTEPISRTDQATRKVTLCLCQFYVTGQEKQLEGRFWLIVSICWYCSIAIHLWDRASWWKKHSRDVPLSSWCLGNRDREKGSEDTIYQPKECSTWTSFSNESHILIVYPAIKSLLTY